MIRRIADFKSFSLLEAYFPETPSPGSRMNKEAFDKMRRCIFYLTAQYPFFAGLLTRLVIRENNTRKTMSTDGYSIHYNSGFVLKHTEAEIIWVVAHEVMHNALLHFARCPKDQDGARLWNIAADYALNQMITEVDQDALSNGRAQPSSNPKNSVGKMPKEALYPGCGYVKGDDKFVNLTAEQIYAELKKTGFTPPDDLPPPPPPPPPAPPQEPKVGDVIYDTENKNYGIITKYDPDTGDVEYDPIPKDKVKEYLK